MNSNLATSTDWVVMVAYFLAILLFGSYFSKYNRTTNDFFFGGRRFSWWLIAMSIVATGVGSHSFIKYSAKGFEAGLSSTMTYLNDWFFLPFFLFGWLPLVVYTKIRSIPEYFEKRFSPVTRFLATILILLYLIGYVGIGLLTMGKAILPLLPEVMSLFGFDIHLTLMGLIVTIAFIVGIYITFGGQTAVIFTDLAQGFVLIFAGLLIFILGLDYLGGIEVFWNLLPMEWKMPLAKFNDPPGFNFVGIFWQDGIAGSVGFLFMNMGLIMRFMATKSVNEGRKAAVFNTLFLLPISAIVVGNAGWIAKAISVNHPNILSPDTNPDEIFVVVTNVISNPGVFGFIMAALTSALMSTVDTLLNASAAIYINDIHRPLKKIIKRTKFEDNIEDKRELVAARFATVAFTILGVLAVIPFSNFPTVYEAHGYFHSTLTPPLVVGIFLGVFWKKFSNTSIITTFIVGVSLMILGIYHPRPLIEIFAHGTAYDQQHPYTYIGALYNLFVCAFVGAFSTLTQSYQMKINLYIKSLKNHTFIAVFSSMIAVISFFVIAFNLTSLEISIFLVVLMFASVSISANYYSNYSENIHTEGLTVWGIAKAKENFKGSKINDAEGEIVKVTWKLMDNNSGIVHFSSIDMEKMKANVGDLVYISDARKYLGGLKSIHSVIGNPHNKEGIVYLSKDNIEQGQFVSGRLLTAEKEM